MTVDGNTAHTDKHPFSLCAELLLRNGNLGGARKEVLFERERSLVETCEGRIFART